MRRVAISALRLKESCTRLALCEQRAMLGMSSSPPRLAPQRGNTPRMPSLDVQYEMSSFPPWMIIVLGLMSATILWAQISGSKKVI